MEGKEINKSRRKSSKAKLAGKKERLSNRST